MIIYRVENDEGVGPHTGHHKSSSWGTGPYQAHDGHDPGSVTPQHPIPDHDNGMSKKWLLLDHSVRAMYNFGFRDQVQFRNWFYHDQWLHGLHAFGFKLWIYETLKPFDEHGNDVCIVGYTQVVFQKNHCKRMGSVSFNRILSGNYTCLDQITDPE